MNATLRLAAVFLGLSLSAKALLASRRGTAPPVPIWLRKDIGLSSDPPTRHENWNLENLRWK
jgi:hypothetical protein